MNILTPPPPVYKHQVSGNLTAKGISLIVDGDPFVINADHMNYNKILDALRARDFDAVPALIDITKTIQVYSDGLVTVANGVVSYAGRELHNALTSRMIQMISLGLEITSLARFLEKLMKNPSSRAVNELFKFIEACDMPITIDGELLVYRSVNNDYWDRHTGKTAYSRPAVVSPTNSLENAEYAQNGCSSVVKDGYRVVSIERNQVDDNPERTCSYGLHVCSQEYGMYGAKLLLCSVDPADVVSVPSEYNAAKMRVCKYRVLKEVPNNQFQSWSDTPVYFEGISDVSEFNGYDEDDDDADDNDRYSW